MSSSLDRETRERVIQYLHSKGHVLILNQPRFQDQVLVQQLQAVPSSFRYQHLLTDIISAPRQSTFSNDLHQQQQLLLGATGKESANQVVQTSLEKLLEYFEIDQTVLKRNQLVQKRVRDANEILNRLMNDVARLFEELESLPPGDQGQFVMLYLELHVALVKCCGVCEQIMQQESVATSIDLQQLDARHTEEERQQLVANFEFDKVWRQITPFFDEQTRLLKEASKNLTQFTKNNITHPPQLLQQTKTLTQKTLETGIREGYFELLWTYTLGVYFSLKQIPLLVQQLFDKSFQFIKIKNEKLFEIVHAQVFCAEIIKTLKQRLQLVIRGYDVAPMRKQVQEVLTDIKEKQNLSDDKNYQLELVAVKKEAQNLELKLQLQEEFIGLQDIFYEFQMKIDSWSDPEQQPEQQNPVKTFQETNKVLCQMHELSQKVKKFIGLDNFFKQEVVVQRMVKFVEENREKVIIKRDEVVKVLRQQNEQQTSKTDKMVSLCKSIVAEMDAMLNSQEKIVVCVEETELKRFLAVLQQQKVRIDFYKNSITSDAKLKLYVAKFDQYLLGLEGLWQCYSVPATNIAQMEANTKARAIKHVKQAKDYLTQKGAQMDLKMKSFCDSRLSQLSSWYALDK